MKKRLLGQDLAVSEIGYGCMGLSGIYGSADDAASAQVIRRAVNLGVTFFDTAESYGNGHNEELVGHALLGCRDDIVLASKFGLGSEPGLGRPERVRGCLEASLRRLQTDHLDLFYLHRVDPDTPIEDTVGAMAACVAAGLTKHIGLSEASSNTIRRAHAVHPLTAVQTEYSLFQRHVEDAILPTLHELGIGFVAYSPLVRGLLGGGIQQPDDLPDGDWRRTIPRFFAASLEQNAALIDAVSGIARASDATPAQVALAWILNRDAAILPIPGTRRLDRLEENVAAADVKLASGSLQVLDDLLERRPVVGERLPPPLLLRTEN